MNLAILTFEGFEELDAIGPYQVFGIAADHLPEFSVSLRTLEDADSLTGAHGLQVVPDGRLADIEPDLVVVPGGGWNDRSEVGAWAEAERGDVPEALAHLHGDGVTIAGVCTGGMLLSRAGLTDGRPAVTHADAVEELQEAGAEVIEARVVDDGDLITAGGVTAGIDLALHILDREYGAELADAIADGIEYSRSDRVAVPSGARSSSQRE